MTQLASNLQANEARQNFYQILKEVGSKLRRFTITHRDGTKAVIMPLEDVEAWEETIEILSDKELMKDLREADEDVKAGRVYSLEKVKKELGINED